MLSFRTNQVKYPQLLTTPQSIDFTPMSVCIPGSSMNATRREAFNRLFDLWLWTTGRGNKPCWFQ